MRRTRAATWTAAGVLVALLGSCVFEPEEASLTELRFPTGAALGPDGRWLFVTNGNLDQGQGGSTLVAIDLEAFEDGLAQASADAGPLGAETTEAQPCRRGVLDPLVIECDERWLIRADGAHSVRLPSGAGNIAIDRPAGEAGPLRLLVPSSFDPAITWVDVVGTGDSLELDCGQDRERVCDGDHTLRTIDNAGDVLIPPDPGRISIDSEGYRFAYLPQLLGGGMTLVTLDGDFGPVVTDVDGDFFPEDLNTETEQAGGFASASRPCDPDDPPLRTDGCTRPYVYNTGRHWPGLINLTVAVGTDLILAAGTSALFGANPLVTEDRPYLGDLEFETPGEGDRLLVVQTTPPALLSVDTSVGEDGEPRDVELGKVDLCRYPNILAVHRPEGAEALALVSCFADDQVAAVGLGAFRLLATIPTGDGPNELVIDDARRWLYVVNTRESTISIVELDHTSPGYLQVIARIGLAPAL